MTQLIEVKEALQQFYTKNEYWVTPLLKALTGFLCFFMIHLQLPSGTMFGSLLIVIAAAALCSFLPWTAITVFSGLFVLGNAYGLSMGLCLLSAFVILLLALVQSAFRAGHGILIALIPLFFYLHIPYVIPAIAGLSLGLMSIVPVSIGVMAYYLIQYAASEISVLSSTEDLSAMLSAYVSLFEGYFQNAAMLISIMAFAVCILLVFILHQLDFSYNWSVALFIGLGSVLLVSAAGAARMGVAFSLGSTLVSLFLSLVISFLYALAFHGADYRGTERLRFEDDDYFYDVKAVPKLKARNEE
ncbi:MAG TPA: hypothetical protein DIW34_07795 [Oribacterium sp.]|nr:hypothetical protein [Oribacterium sp.]